MKWCCPALSLSICLASAATAAPPHIAARLTEQWRLTDSEDSFLIADIVDAASDAAGNVYLLDFKLQTVAVVNAAGELMRTIGGPGDGPGETRTASRLFVEPDGRVGLLDMLSSRLEWFDAAGRPLATSHLRLNADGSGALATYDARRWAGGYVAAFMVRDETAKSHALQVALVSVPADGSSTTILHRVTDKAASAAGPLTAESDTYNFVWNAWDVDNLGNVYLAPERDQPRVLVLPAGGGKPTWIALAAGRRARTAAEKAVLAAGYAKPGGNAAGPEIADHDAFVGHLRCDDKGRVWVHTSLPEPAPGPGVFVEYDVYSSGGEHLQRVDLVGPDDARRDAWFMLRGDRVVVVRNARDREAAEGPEVVYYSFGLE